MKLIAEEQRKLENLSEAERIEFIKRMANSLGFASINEAHNVMSPYELPIKYAFEKTIPIHRVNKLFKEGVINEEVKNILLNS